jgi:hypothetical protein
VVKAAFCHRFQLAAAHIFAINASAITGSDGTPFILQALHSNWLPFEINISTTEKFYPKVTIDRLSL